ncbi:MAG: hypothetical protein ACREIC_25400, partial [Limisphaerales bacterium]
MNWAPFGVGLLSAFAGALGIGAEVVPKSAVTLSIEHPISGAIFPANMPAPVVLWKASGIGATGLTWSAQFKVGEREWGFPSIHPLWRPDSPAWQAIKQAAEGKTISLTLSGNTPGPQSPPVVQGSVSFSISEEAMRFPLFFREVNLPFQEAVKDPSKIRWRFGTIDTVAPPPVVLENLPVCGNCHSFSRDGGLLAMDVD